MKIRYNAPVTLTFTLVCVGVLAANQFLFSNLISAFFVVPGRMQFSFTDFFGYFRLLSHVIGHANWGHLMSNFSFILLLGPVLEEKYGSGSVLFMILITAFITGILNVVFFTTGLLGASGIVFMMILLMSFANVKRGEIPITLLLIVALYITKEVMNAFQNNSVSEFAHIIGGFCGGLFGFLQTPQAEKKGPEDQRITGE